MSSFLILLFTAFIAYEVPQIVNLIAIIGGLIFTSLAITIPGNLKNIFLLIILGMCYYKLNGPYKVIVLFFTIVLSCIGFTASILSLLDTIGVIQLN